MEVISFGLFFLFFAVIIGRELRSRKWGEALDLVALISILVWICVASVPK